MTWLLIGVLAAAVVFLLWRLDRRMRAHGITSDPAAGSGLGNTNASKITDGTGGP